MLKNKAVKILSTLTREELKQFEEFICSPYFNKNKNLLKLFEVLENYHPGYDVSIEFLHSQVYSGKTFNNSNMKKLMSDMLAICDKFLRQLRFEKEHFQNELFLLREYEERKLDQLFSLNCAKTDDNISSKKLFATHIDKSQLEEIKINFFQSRNIGFKEMEHFNVKLECALIFFLDSLFSELQSKYIYKSNYNIENIKPFSEYFLRSFDVKSFSKELNFDTPDHKLILILLNFILMTTNPEDDSGFQNAKKYLLEYPISDRESCSDLINLYDAFYNHCIQKITRGNDKIRFDLFEIFKHKFKLVKKFNLENTINWALFRNVSMNAINIGEIKWAEKFIEENLKLIPEEFQEDIRNYLMAFIEFKLKKYEKALEFASKVNINYHNLKLTIKVLMLNCFYELDAFETAISMADSYKHFLSNDDKIEKELKEKYNGYIKIYLQLLKYKLNPETLNGFDLNCLRKEILDLNLMDKWVISKIEEFEKIISENNHKSKNK